MKCIGQKIRKDQNPIHIYNSIYNSITEASDPKIVAETQNYRVQGTLVDEIIFKFMIQKEVIVTIATESHLRENLTNLETHITTVKSNIQTFNQNVKVNLEGLKARGERTDYGMTKLLREYHTASYT